MGEKKIADSRIIRVGCGIREVPREQPISRDVIEPSSKEPDVKQSDDANSFPSDYGPASKISKDGSIVN